MRYSSWSLSFVLACAVSPIVAYARSQEAPPKPGPEVKKLAVMVGRFTNEGELKAGMMTPNSPAMKVSGTDECKWTADGFGLICTYTWDVGSTKFSETAIIYYDAISQKYQFHGVTNTGETADQTGTVSGDTWTWPGKGVLDGKVFYTRFVMKFVSNDSYDYSEEWGDSENSMKLAMTGKDTRAAITKPATSKPAN